MHRADIVMITNFWRVVILLIMPLFIVDIIEFIVILKRKIKNGKIGNFFKKDS